MENTKFTFPINQQLNCSSNNSIFVDDVQFLLDLSASYLKKINNSQPISAEIITSLGDEFTSLLSTPTDDHKNDLHDETRYSEKFIGPYAEKFIEILKLIQLLSQQSWHLDTYLTLELLDQGVRQKDQEQFLHDLKLLNNKLLILDKAIKNRE